MAAFLPYPLFTPTNTPTPCSSPTMKSKKRRPKPSKDHKPRIDLSNSTLSLREQLSLAKAAAADTTPSRPVVRTKFRKKKAVTTRPEPPPDASLPDGKYMKTRDPVLYIDGYNVIGAWPRLRKFRDRGDLDAARNLLISDVAEFSYVRGWDCVVVFDAQGTAMGEKQEIYAGVNVVYTGSETADSYIERCVYQMCESGDRQVWAATSDVAQLSFSSGKGAHIMSSKLFVQEIKRAKKETSDRVSEHDGSALKGNMLISNVDQVTRDRLYKMRDGKL